MDLIGWNWLDMKDGDHSPTEKQTRLMLKIGVPTQRRRFITKRAASRLIARMLAEQYREQERCRAKQATQEQSQNVAAAWQKIQELQEQQCEADWVEIQKRFLEVTVESSNTESGDVQSASQGMNG